MSVEDTTEVERPSRWRGARSAGGGLLRRLASKWKAFVFLALLILAWQAYTEWGHTERFVLPPPSSVWTYLIHNPRLY